LPPQDARSRAIVEQMRVDEAEHGAAARALGAVEMPAPGARSDESDVKSHDSGRLLPVSKPRNDPGCRITRLPWFIAVVPARSGLR